MHDGKYPSYYEVNQNFKDNNDRVTGKLMLKRENLLHARTRARAIPKGTLISPENPEEAECRFGNGLCAKPAY